MANTIQVDIVSAEEQIFSGEAYMVYAPAVMISTWMVLAITIPYRVFAFSATSSMPPIM